MTTYRRRSSRDKRDRAVYYTRAQSRIFATVLPTFYRAIPKRAFAKLVYLRNCARVNSRYRDASRSSRVVISRRRNRLLVMNLYNRARLVRNPFSLTANNSDRIHIYTHAKN